MDSLYPYGWGELFALTHGAWLLSGDGGAPADLYGMVRDVGPEEVADFARRNLTQDSRFVVTDGGGTTLSLWPLLLLVLVVLAIDGSRGFPWARKVQSRWRGRRRAPRAPARASPATKKPKPKPVPPRPGAVDELDQQLQDFYAQEDRDRDPPEATGV